MIWVPQVASHERGIQSTHSTSPTEWSDGCYISTCHFGSTNLFEWCWCVPFISCEANTKNYPYMGPTFLYYDVIKFEILCFSMILFFAFPVCTYVYWYNNLHYFWFLYHFGHGWWNTRMWEWRGRKRVVVLEMNGGKIWGFNIFWNLESREA